MVSPDIAQADQRASVAEYGRREAEARHLGRHLAHATGLQCIVMEHEDSQGYALGGSTTEQPPERSAG